VTADLATLLRTLADLRSEYVLELPDANVVGAFGQLREGLDDGVSDVAGGSEGSEVSELRDASVASPEDFAPPIWMTSDLSSTGPSSRAGVP
jgi:hypothetical protein